MKLKVVAIVPAAGLGRRFGNSERKPFAKVADTPLLIYTLKSLHKTKTIAEIIPVLRKEDMKRGLELIESYNLKKIKKIVPGGKERQDSVYNALGLIKRDCLILIHDGVRPLISTELTERLLKEIKRSRSTLGTSVHRNRLVPKIDSDMPHRRTGFDGVIPGLSVRETLKKVDTKGFVSSTVERDKFLIIQTPQVFPFKVIKTAYDRAYEDGFNATDDAALVERIGGKVKIIRGDPINIKVTTPEDMDMVEYLLKKKK